MCIRDSICTLPLKPDTQLKKAGLAGTSVCTLEEVISYARVVTSSPKRSTIIAENKAYEQVLAMVRLHSDCNHYQSEYI